MIKVLFTTAFLAIIFYIVWAIITTKKEEIDEMLKDKECDL